MAQVNQRLWKLPGQRTKRKAWGFTAQINGKQVRRYKAEWTQDDAEAELAKALAAVRKVGEGEAALERRLTAAAVNRPLALLRHLLRLAHEEWEAIESVPASDSRRSRRVGYAG